MKKTVNVTVKVDNVPMLKKELMALLRYDLVIGFPEEKDKGRYDTDATNAEIAYFNDRGSPAKNIPARPFVLPALQKAQSRMLAQYRLAATEALNGKPEKVVQRQNAARIIGQEAIQMYMTTTNFPPLAPSTIKARRARGFLGTRPLIETGQLRAAVGYALRPKGRR